jgi:O-antigen/teichoic acid export membrane protein
VRPALLAISMSNSRSGLSRILSASAAAWARIGITIVSQIALVPLYLSSWDAEVYGAWLLLQAVWTSISIIDLGHHEYIGFECLRRPADNRAEIAEIMMSALPVAALISAWDILLVTGLVHSSQVAAWVGADDRLFGQWSDALLLQAVTAVFTTGIGGILIRGIAPFGHYPRVAWWGTFYAIITAAAPGLAVYLGTDLWETALVLCATNIAYYTVHFLDITRIVRREQLFAAMPHLLRGIRRGGAALWLVAKTFAEMLRQQGTRLLLAPLAGVSDLAAFATMRTGANFALQGLNTITGPVMPELMRYLSARDQQRTESAFAVVWLMLCAVLCPAVLLVQYVAPFVFPLWTQGKIQFDPQLFLMLSLGVLIVALAQPATAILQGNNLLRHQLAISLVAATTTVVALFLLVPRLGIKGAALGLLIAELVSLSIYCGIAIRWLGNQGMRWPTKAFFVSALSIVNGALGMSAIATVPEHSLACLAGSLAIQAGITAAYWRQLPPIARNRASGLLDRFKPRFARA